MDYAATLLAKSAALMLGRYPFHCQPRENYHPQAGWHHHQRTKAGITADGNQCYYQNQVRSPENEGSDISPVSLEQYAYK